MRNLAIIFGGDSVEHDVSVLTGLHAAQNVNDDTNVVLVYLTRMGQMVTSGARGVLSKVENYTDGKAERSHKCFFDGGVLYAKRKFFLPKKVGKINAVLNCCHGGAGENGQLAGMLEMFGVPVTSCGYLSAGTLQSKFKTREILEKAGYPQPKYIKLIKSDKEKGVTNGMDFPLIVKPDTLGSSIGISVVRNDEELGQALDLAFSLDDVVIVEQFLADSKEINCAAFRFGDEIRFSKCEIVNEEGGMYDFDSKYLGQIDAPCKKSIEENVNDEEGEMIATIQRTTKDVYELFQCSGVVRADFLVHNETVYLNEINTVPGFLSYHLWLKSGLPYGALIDLLVEQAKKDTRNRPKIVFESEILQKNRFLTQ